MLVTCSVYRNRSMQVQTAGAGQSGPRDQVRAMIIAQMAARMEALYSTHRVADILAQRSDDDHNL